MLIITLIRIGKTVLGPLLRREHIMHQINTETNHDLGKWVVITSS